MTRTLKAVDLFCGAGGTSQGAEQSGAAKLSLAMSFPSPYIFHGNKGEVTKQIGNAVCPSVAEAITTAFAGAA